MPYINENLLCIFILPVLTGIITGICFLCSKKTYLGATVLIAISLLYLLIINNINTHGSEGPILIWAMYSCVTAGFIFVEIIKFIFRLVRKKKENNMNYKKSRNLMWIGFALAILIMVIGTGFENEKVTGWFVFSGTIVFISALLQAFAFYVCPYCGYSLMNVRGAIPEHCPKCGNKLKD